jgi:hypothetical protein
MIPHLPNEASCLCYTTQDSTLVYAPTVYDGLLDSCLAYFKTAMPSFTLHLLTRYYAGSITRAC